MTPVPDSPYKGLAAFEDSELDALLFFGREREIEAAAANVLASRLTVLYGPSGVGKSSLLAAGVARRLRELSGAPVVVHDSWVEDPAAGLVASVHAECGELGPTAGLVDTIAAAAQQRGELHLLLDQFEDYMLYHGLDGPLSAALPELLRRPGLRVNVLLALRDDALAELDDFSGRIPELFGNLLRLDRLDRDAGRAAILGPLERYGELSGERFTAEDELVETVLDEASTAEGVEAPYLQLVLERLWERERAEGSRTLRLSTLRAIGGARAVVREHVQGALESLTLTEQEAAARVVRQLVTPSGRKVSHEPADLAEYAHVDDAQLRSLLETLSRERIVRGVNGTGSPTRYEIFHDVLGPPILAWQAEHQLRAVRERARLQRRRLLAVVGASLVALALVAAIAVYALVQRSDARTQAGHARGRALAAQALAEIPSNPQASVRLALQATALAPGRATADVLRSSLGAMRETAILRPGGNIVAAAFAPQGDGLVVASSNGRLALYNRNGRRVAALPRQRPLTTAAWSPDGRIFAAGSTVNATIWRGTGAPTTVPPTTRVPITVPTGARVTALSFDRTTLLIGSGTHIRLFDLATHHTKTLRFPGAVVAAALDPTGRVFAVSFRHGKETTAAIVNARTGHTVAPLREDGIRSFAFSPDGNLLATGSYDRTARLWNVGTGKLLHVLEHHGYVLDESFSDDGSSLVTAASDGGGYVWDVANGQRELLLVGATGPATAAAFSPDGSEIALGSTDWLARLYYSEDGRLLAPLAGHGAAVTTVGFDSSGRTLVTGGADGTVRLWDALPEGTLKTIDARPSSVQAFFAGDDAVTVAGRQARILTTSGRVLRTVTLPAPITATAANERFVALADAAGDLTIASPSADRPFERVPGITALAYAGRTLLVGTADGSVLAGKLQLRVPGPVRSLAAGGGRFLVRLPTQIRVYAVEGRLISTIHTAAQHAALSPGGLGVATTKGAVAQLWDATTGKLLHTLVGHRSPITDVEFSPSGLDLVTVSLDHTGLIWSARSGRLVRHLIGHFFPVYSGSYSPDGHWIVTASQFTAGLWKTGNGQLLFYLGRHAKPLTGASFSPTGDWILTGSQDGTARVYHCLICQPLPALEATARARLNSLR
jgi:WD40 repeat protein